MADRRRPVRPNKRLVEKREAESRLERSRRHHEAYLGTLEGAAFVRLCREFSQKWQRELAELEAEKKAQTTATPE